MKCDRFDIVEYPQKMSLDGVWVAGLTQDFQQGGIRHEEKARENQTFFLKVTENHWQQM